MAVVKLLPYQRELLMSIEPHVALIAGRGCGKTFLLAHQVIALVAQYPGIDILIAANTFAQLTEVTIKVLIDQLEEHNIPHHAVLGGSKKQVIIGQGKAKSTLYLRSLEKEGSTRGLTVGAILYDEVCFSKKASVDVSQPCLRQPDMPHVSRYFSSPNGFNWLYEFFVTNVGPTRKLIRAKTLDNFLLPDSYYPNLLDVYGSTESPMFKQEVDGEFINLTEGCVYGGFDREEHVKPVTLHKHNHVYAAVDFNIDRLSGVYAQYINDILYVGKEIATEQSNINTFDLATKMQVDLMDYQFRSVIPDSTGKARKSSATRSDHQILQDAGFKLEIKTNPLIRDRQNSVNRLLNQNKIVIDPSCTALIKELETLSQRDDEGKVSHISVALGYLVWKLAPIKRPQAKSTSFYI